MSVADVLELILDVGTSGYVGPLSTPREGA
jgi:hypothetical protein